jgi:putative glutamine amidotransferase
MQSSNQAIEQSSNKRLPLIGITVESRHEPENDRSRGKMELNWNYAQAIAEAGGVPVVIPPVADMGQVSRIIDGWLIPGGLDIDAKHFGEENHPKVELQHPSRFAAEKALLDAVDPEMPVLGICYGCQFLNVARGGSLIQHLPDVVGHEAHTGGATHPYTIDPQSKLHQVTGAACIEGRSYHHQAVKAVGRGLRVVATDEDGTVEAIEATDRPWTIGVQWHPERTMDDEATRRLFNAFVQAAAEYAARKG